MEKITISYNNKVLAIIGTASKKLSLNNQGISNIEDVKNLDKLGQLEELELNDNDISEIRGLDNLVSLRVLSIRGKESNKGQRIAKIEGLDELSKLERLDLASNDITKMENLHELYALKVLGLRDNPISGITGLNRLEQLKALDLEMTSISEITGLDKLGNLEFLGLMHCRISKIQGLNNLTRMNMLELNYNMIESIEGLSNLIMLKILLLNNNKIQEIEGLETLFNLNKCELGENQIHEIKNLDALVDLKHLDLHGNNITKIKGLDALVNLEELDLSSNNIRSISGLGTLNKLQSLKIGSNPLSKDILNFVDDDNGYAWHPDEFVAYCKGDMEALLPPWKKPPVERSNLVGDPSMFQFRQGEVDRFVTRTLQKIKDAQSRMWPTFFSGHYELALLYLNLGDFKASREHANVILENKEFIDFFNGNGCFFGSHLDYFDDNLTYEELKKTSHLENIILFINLFYGDRVTTRKWCDIIINAYGLNEKARFYPLHLIALLLEYDVDTLSEISKERVYTSGKEFEIINVQYYILEFARFIENKQFDNAQAVLLEFKKRVLDTNIDIVFSDELDYFPISIIMKDVLDDASDGISTYIFKE